MLREPKIFRIWDLPDTIYVRLKDDFRDVFFKECYAEFGSRRQYAIWLGKNPADVRKYHLGWSKSQGKKCNCSIPNWVIKKSLALVSIQTKNELEENTIHLQTHGGSDFFYPKFPIEEKPEVYRIIAHMIGDGSALTRKQPYYANTCKDLREEFKSDLLSLGKMKISESCPNTVSIVVFPKIVSDILADLFDVKFSSPDRLPELIFSASDECKRAFIRAIFDDEGTVCTHVAITIHNEEILWGIKKLLVDFRIDSGSITKSKYVTKKGNRTRMSMALLSQSVRTYSQQIGFTHPVKSINLEHIIRNKERNLTQRTRSKELIERQILKLLQEKPMPSLEMCKVLLFSISGLYNHLYELEREKKIERFGHKNKYFWKLRTQP